MGDSRHAIRAAWHCASINERGGEPNATGTVNIVHPVCRVAAIGDQPAAGDRIVEFDERVQVHRGWAVVKRLVQSAIQKLV